MLRIAIIGCGLIGEEHTRALASLGVTPVLFIDENVTRGEALARAFGGRSGTDPSEAMTAPDVDAVYICTYHDTHASLAVAAAGHRKHIFLEKPMAIRPDDCLAISRAVAAAGVTCMTGFKLHYYSLTREAKRRIGKPLALSAHVLDRRWPDDSWANDPLLGGGNVLSQGCHAVDLLCYLAAAKPTRIHAEGGNLHHPGLDITDTMAATLSFENGAVATLLVGDVGEAPHDGKFTVQAMNGRESIHLYDRLQRLSYSDGAAEHVISGAEDGFLEENREFLAALAEGRRPETSELEGYRASMILLAGLESIRTKQPQSLLDLP